MPPIRSEVARQDPRKTSYRIVGLKRTLVVGNEKNGKAKGSMYLSAPPVPAHPSPGAPSPGAPQSRRTQSRRTQSPSASRASPNAPPRPGRRSRSQLQSNARQFDNNIE